jgi:hypothetical protein
MRQKTPESGVRYGQLATKRGIMVRATYTNVTIARMAAATTTIAEFIGNKNATRPAKNRSRDMCKRRGMRSTTACMRKSLRPLYR